MMPLEDIQIVSMAINIPGPVAVARLGKMGARVVKVEPPGGDQLALASRKWYASLHEGIEVRSLDLKSGEGKAEMQDLLAESDLFITSSRPSALRRLGLDWPTLAGRYPRLCQVAIIGYPSPDEERPGHDLTYLAGLGLLNPPELPRTVLADLAGAEWTVSASLALLLGREQASGEPLPAEDRYAEVSLAEAAESFSLPLQHGLTAPGGFLGGGMPGYNIYQAQDGWIALGALELHFLERLGNELGLVKVTKAALMEAFLTRPADEWEQWAAERDLPIAVVRSRR